MTRIALTLLACLFTLGANAKPVDVEWSELIDPAAQTFEDPYRNLSFEQLSILRDIVRTRAQLEGEGLDPEDRAEIEAQLSEKEAALAAEEIKVDWLLEQRWIVAQKRERAFNAGNPEVDGEIVRLSGYAILAPADPDGTPVAYLVPERGMCSHTPPPNPNQMIRVRLGTDWQPRYMHEPVHLTGPLSISPSEEVMVIVDGPVQMRATFAMEVNNAETVKDFGANARNAAKGALAKYRSQELQQSTAKVEKTDSSEVAE